MPWGARKPSLNNCQGLSCTWGGQLAVELGGLFYTQGLWGTGSTQQQRWRRPLGWCSPTLHVPLQQHSAPPPSRLAGPHFLLKKPVAGRAQLGWCWCAQPHTSREADHSSSRYQRHALTKPRYNTDRANRGRAFHGHSCTTLLHDSKWLLFWVPKAAVRNSAGSTGFSLWEDDEAELAKLAGVNESLVTFEPGLHKELTDTAMLTESWNWWCLKINTLVNRSNYANKNAFEWPAMLLRRELTCKTTLTNPPQQEVHPHLMLRRYSLSSAFLVERNTPQPVRQGKVLSIVST